MTAVLSAWSDGLPIWWALQDDVCAEKGIPTLTTIVRQVYAGPSGGCSCGVLHTCAPDLPAGAYEGMFDYDDEDDWSLPCGCTYRPGITLPVTECEQHATDPSLAHPLPRRGEVP